MTTHPTQRIFWLALVLALILLSGYEWYWGQVSHWPKGHDLENLDTWSDQRGKLDRLDSQDVVIIGSSRAHFDININLWDSLTGRKPVQLAYPGSSPYHVLDDLVHHSDYKGLLVIGVSPGLFFTMEGSWGANRGKAFVDRFHERTYAQVLNQQLYYHVDPYFSYLQEELSYENLIDRLPFPDRDSVWHPDIWPPMVKMDRSRNIRMISEMETDTVLQNWQKKIWFNPDPKNHFTDSAQVILDYYSGLVKEFTARGGRVVFIRPPVTGFYLETEFQLYPREEYWDKLLAQSGCFGIHFSDFEELSQMNPPEWSHLNRAESDQYTATIIRILQTKNLL